MLTVQLTCPHCTRILRCHRSIAPGERLRCSHCGGQFHAGIGGASGGRQPPDSLERRQPSVRENRGANAPRSPHSNILLGWLLFTNLLLLVGGGIIVAVVFNQRARTDEGTSREPSRTAVLSVPDPVPVPTPAPERDPIVPPPPPPPSIPTPAADLPAPPPLPSPPPPREAKPPTPAKAKTPEPEKPAAPARPRPETARALWLPAPIQKQVDRSVDSGVEYLRRQQHADGSWGHQIGKAGKRFTPGITALSGLTLLECGAPAKDGQVQSVARYLRLHMPDLTTTYSISLAILFFDRLDDAEDAARIRTLSLRLLAGQRPSGGWDYYCPTLGENDELGLLARLYKDRPTKPVELFAVEPQSKDENDLYRPKPSKNPPLELFVAQGTAAPSTPKPPMAESQKPIVDSPKPKAESRDLPGDSRLLSKRALEAADKLSETLQRTPALRAAELMREPPDLSEPRTDNSNTQFAILGLLTAENHDVPMERAMALLDWRFRNSITVLNGWNYRPNTPVTPSMTAAALMGLALKHGLLLPNRRARGRNVAVHDDEVMHHGFLTLKGLLETYFAGFVFNQARLDKLDLYCLWTVERVAVLYNLRTFGSLEWYPAGVQLLLPLQREDGSWTPKGTTCLEEPCVATSFALLFLKRSNLARELTERLNAPAD